MRDPALTDAFTLRDGELWIDGVPARHLLERHGTPVLVYSRRRLESNLHSFAQGLSGVPHRLYFPVKACYAPPVLAAVREMGMGFEIISELEFHLCEPLTGGTDLIWSGPGKRRTELRYAIGHGATLTADSASELREISDLCRATGANARVALRLRLMNLERERQEPSFWAGGRLGLDYPGPHAEEAAAMAATLPGLRWTGIHHHAYAAELTPGRHASALAELLDLAGRWSAAYGADLREINLGGGMPPELLLGPQGRTLAGFLRQAAAPMRRARPDTRLLLEPGRSVVGDAGVVLCRVVRVKRNGGRRWAIVNASTNMLVGGPNSAYPITTVDALPGMTEHPCRKLVPWSVGDGICTPTGTLAEGVMLPDDLQEGEVLAIWNAGAYTLSRARSFIYAVPPTLFLDDGRVRVVSPGTSARAEAGRIWSAAAAELTVLGGLPER